MVRAAIDRPSARSRFRVSPNEFPLVLALRSPLKASTSPVPSEP